jgi:hypothetical protein
MLPESVELSAAFPQTVADGIEGILAHQQGDGSILFDPSAAAAWQQHCILALAFCYAEPTPERPMEMFELSLL